MLHPPVRADATTNGICGQLFHIVSILARPVGRALQQAGLPWSSVSKVSILARPVGRALRYFLVTVQR